MAISLKYQAGVLLLTLVACEHTVRFTPTDYAHAVQHNPNLLALAGEAMRKPGCEVEATYGVDGVPYPRMSGLRKGFSLVTEE